MQRIVWRVVWLCALAVWPVVGLAQDMANAAGDNKQQSYSFSDFASENGFESALRFDYYRSDKKLDSKTNFFGTTAQFKLVPKITSSITGKIDARVTNPNIGSGDATYGTVREAYFDVNFSNAKLRIGKQIIAWGRADGLNPTDNLTPRDYEVLLPYDDDQRFGTRAAKFDYYIDDYSTFTLFTSPYFEPSKFPLVGATFVTTTPEHNLSNSEVGLKLDRSGGSIDGSISYYHGFSLLPVLQPLGATPSGAVLGVSYPKMNVYGADVATNFGRYGFRGEIAYIDPEDNRDVNPATIRPYVYMVSGVDRTFFNNLYVNIQVIGRWVRNYTNPELIADPLTRATAVQNAITFGQQDKSSYGMTLRISDKWLNNTLKAEIRALVYFGHNKSWYIRPRISYAISDNLRTAIGAEFYGGADDTYFGRLHANAGIFSELRYDF